MEHHVQFVIMVCVVTYNAYVVFIQVIHRLENIK